MQLIASSTFSKEELENGEEIAKCPSCSLMIKVIYDKDDFIKVTAKTAVKQTA